MLKTKGFIEPKGSKRDFEGGRRGFKVKTKGFIKPLALGRMGGRRNGWVEGEGKGVYEAYEVKNKREKLRCLLLRRKKKIIYFIFMK